LEREYYEVIGFIGPNKNSILIGQEGYRSVIDNEISQQGTNDPQLNPSNNLPAAFNDQWAWNGGKMPTNGCVTYEAQVRAFRLTKGMLQLLKSRTGQVDRWRPINIIPPTPLYGGVAPVTSGQLVGVQVDVQDVDPFPGWDANNPIYVLKASESGKRKLTATWKNGGKVTVTSEVIE
jgi:hypothetical protein